MPGSRTTASWAYYHGKPIREDKIADVKHLGYWDAKRVRSRARKEIVNMSPSEYTK